MAPALLHTSRNVGPRAVVAVAGDSAWETQASWRHGHFAAKSAPHHRDFAAGKVEVIK